MFPSPYDNQQISNKLMEKVINQYRDSAPFNFQQHPAQRWQLVRHVFISIMKHVDEEHTAMYHIKYIKTPRHHTYTTLYWNEIWKLLLMKKVPQPQSSPSNFQYHFDFTYISCYDLIRVEYQSTTIYIHMIQVLFIDIFLTICGQEISNKHMEIIVHLYSVSAPLNSQQYTAQSWQRVRHVFISNMEHADEEHTDMYHIKYIKTRRHYTYTTLYSNEIWKSLLMMKVPQLQSAPSNIQHQFDLTYNWLQ